MCAFIESTAAVVMQYVKNLHEHMVSTSLCVHITAVVRVQQRTCSCIFCHDQGILVLFPGVIGSKPFLAKPRVAADTAGGVGRGSWSC
jgi:hypothetical protein